MRCDGPEAVARRSHQRLVRSIGPVGKKVYALPREIWKFVDGMPPGNIVEIIHGQETVRKDTVPRLRADQGDGALGVSRIETGHQPPFMAVRGEDLLHVRDCPAACFGGLAATRRQQDCQQDGGKGRYGVSECFHLEHVEMQS